MKAKIYQPAKSATQSAKSDFWLLEFSSQDKPIIDVRSVNFYTKHDKEALKYAQEIMGCNPEQSNLCILVDDSQTNIRVAKMAGWKTVLIGNESRDGKPQRDFEYADHVIDKVTDLDKVLPDLFHPQTN